MRILKTTNILPRHTRHVIELNWHKRELMFNFVLMRQVNSMIGVHYQFHPTYYMRGSIVFQLYKFLVEGGSPRGHVHRLIRSGSLGTVTYTVDTRDEKRH